MLYHVVVNCALIQPGIFKSKTVLKHLNDELNHFSNSRQRVIYYCNISYKIMVVDSNDHVYVVASGFTYK